MWLCLLGLGSAGCKAEPVPDEQQELGAETGDLSEPADLSGGDDLRGGRDLGADLRASGEDLRSLADLRAALDLSGVDGCGADLQNDPLNCGACGHACAAGGLCCAGQCRDPMSDNANCRSCGHSCGANACCGGLCTSVSTPANCGACGVACAAGKGCCGGACIDRGSNPENCGFCGNRCAAGSVCAGGTCRSGDAGLPDMSGPGCLSGGKTPPAACFTDRDAMSGAAYVICRSDCMSAWVHHADPGGGSFQFQTICQRLGYSRADQWGGTCGDICGYCEGKMNSCSLNGTEKYDNGGMCGPDCLQVTVMWRCVR